MPSSVVTGKLPKARTGNHATALLPKGYFRILTDGGKEEEGV